MGRSCIGFEPEPAQTKQFFHYDAEGLSLTTIDPVQSPRDPDLIFSSSIGQNHFSHCVHPPNEAPFSKPAKE